MRYLIDPEYRAASPPAARRPQSALSAELRRELSARNLHWAASGNYAHEVTIGALPAVIYREDETGAHGNFLPASYRAIKENAAWNRRLKKVHTSAHRALLSRDADRCELDSSNSSDALLMNIFCHPGTFKSSEVTALLGIDAHAELAFGYRPRTPLRNGRRDATEIDLKLGDLLIEAKLTESDFQTAPAKMVERYRDFEVIFDLDLLGLQDGYIRSYQLVRGILAAAAQDNRFCVLCDARRVDLIDAWHRVMMAVRGYDLRCRLQLLTWQEMAACLPLELREFLGEKFGITGGLTSRVEAF